MNDRFRLNKEINLGEILSVLTIVGVVMVWGFTLKGDLEVTKQRTTALEQRQIEDRTEYRESLKEVSIKLDTLLRRSR